MTDYIRQLDLPPDSAIHQALAVLRDERDAAQLEAEHYRRKIFLIRAHAGQVGLTLVESMAHRALLWEGRERRRTLRDRLAAWWQTKWALWRTK